MPDISLHHLEADPRNPNVCSEETLQKIKTNIQRTGLCPPLIIRPHPTKEKLYIIIDGHHRKKALESLGWKKAPCQIWQVSDQEAQIALATLNRLRGNDIPHKRAELLQSLTQLIPPKELAFLIPETSSQIEDALRFLKADFEGLENALKTEIETETAALPTTYTFLIQPGDKEIVDKAFSHFSKEGSDRSQTLVRICNHVLEA